MKIHKLDVALETPYSEFIAGRCETLIYHSLPFQRFACDMLDASLETLVAVDAAGEPRGALPLLAKAGPWGTVYNSLPFFGSHGSIVAPDPEARSLLVEAYNRLSGAEGVASSVLVTNPLDDAPHDGFEHNLTDSRIGQFTSIRFESDHETGLMERFHYKTRNMVRKAAKAEIDVAVDNGALGFLEEVHRENLAVLGGQPKPPSFFALLPHYFRPGIDYRIYVASRHGTAIAALLLLYFRDTVEYYMPVIRQEHRELQPMSLLIFRAMIEASQTGHTLWNWGGTWATQDGVYRFKSRWGTEDRPYRYFIRLNRDDVRKRQRGEILEAYPYFYVLPFSALVH